MIDEMRKRQRDAKQKHDRIWIAFVGSGRAG